MQAGIVGNLLQTDICQQAQELKCSESVPKANLSQTLEASIRSIEHESTTKRHQISYLRWCREGESNPHEVALGGF